MSLVFNEASHRYKLDGKPVSGATTILGGGIPKPALIWWAPGVVAKFVTDPDNAGKVAELLAGDRDQSIKFLQLLPNQERDSAAERGTEVHDLAEKLATTGEVDAPEDLIGFIEGYLDFLDRWQITPVLVERIVANRKEHFAGKFDLIATSPFLNGGKPVMVDLKTSKSVYVDTALQCAAYANAEFYVDDSGNEQPFPELAASYVLHVTPMDREGINARYEGSPLGSTLYQLSADREEIAEHYQQFLHAKAVHEDAKARGKKKLQPINPPTEMKVAA